MIIKVLFIAAILFLIRSIFKSLNYYGQIKQNQQSQKKKKSSQSESFDAEYTVVDDDK